MKRRIETLSDGASGMAQALFPGIRPSVSRWAMWVIAGQWMVAVAGAIADITQHGQNIDQPVERLLTMGFFSITGTLYLLLPAGFDQPDETEPKERFWRAIAYPWVVLVCWLIANRWSIPVPAEPVANLREAELRIDSALLYLILLVPVLMRIRTVATRAFPRGPGNTTEAQA